MSLVKNLEYGIAVAGYRASSALFELADRFSPQGPSDASRKRYFGALNRAQNAARVASVPSEKFLKDTHRTSGDMEKLVERRIVNARRQTA